MPLREEAKKYLIEWSQLVSEKIDKEKFRSLSDMGDRAEVLSELFPDEIWSKELVLVSVVLHVCGATLDHHFKELADEEKKEAKDSFKKLTKELSDGIKNEDRERVRNSLRDLCYEVYNIFKGV